jgi:acetyl esterase
MAKEEGLIDPWVSQWIASNPLMTTPIEDLSPDLLRLARAPVGSPPTRHIDQVRDDVIEGIPVRIYRNEDAPSGLIVYLHGGGFVMGSIGLMDNIARELAHCAGAVVVSVEYRLAPEDPFPAGLEDCLTVTRWALGNASRFGASSRSVAVAGESAGGNLATAVALRLRDAEEELSLAGQVLIYPVVGGTASFPSRELFSGLIISQPAMDRFWTAYAGGRDLDSDHLAVPLVSQSLNGLPPTYVVLGGCDMLRDEGRLYARRLLEEGVSVEEACYPGQPHGFVNFGFPAATLAFERIGAWLRAVFRRRSRSAVAER